MSRVLQELQDGELPLNDIKVAFFDIDGTLLGLDGSYTQASVRAIRQLQNLGVKTAVASGRPFFAAKYLCDALPLKDPGVFCTGAHIYDPAQNKTLDAQYLTHSIVTTLIKDLRQSNLHYEIYTEDDYFIERDNRPGIRQVHSEHMRCSPKTKDFEQLAAEGNIIKFIVAVDNTLDQAKLHDMEKRFPDLHFAYAGIAAYPDWLFASIIINEDCKSLAFDTLCQYHGVSASQVISFGDAHSDLVFLKKAGVGVAMGNARDEIQAAANLVTKPVWEDGVAYAISRLFNMEGVL